MTTLPIAPEWWLDTRPSDNGGQWQFPSPPSRQKAKPVTLLGPQTDGREELEWDQDRRAW
jgi:hypothetical protein